MIEWKSCWRAALSIFALYLGITYWPAVQQFAAMLLSAALPLLLGCVIAYVSQYPDELLFLMQSALTQECGDWDVLLVAK